MADDDDTRDAVGADELFAPSGPRRSNFTPPTNDAETLEAANNLFNDDAIAAALAAELAKVASGPIPIIRPQAVPGPTPAEPEVAAPPDEPAAPEPVAPAAFESLPSYPPSAPTATSYVAPASEQTSEVSESAFEQQPEPEHAKAPSTPEPPVQSYFAPPPSDFGTPITPDAPDLGTVWSLDDSEPSASSAPVWGEPPAAAGSPEPAAAEPAASAPVAPAPVVPPSPFAPEARAYYAAASQPEPAQPEAPQPEPEQEQAGPIHPEPIQPDSPVPSPIFPGTPAGQFVPTAVPQLSNPEQQQPWPPAPEASAAPVDQPPPYLGAPAPTVPAADVPPPPGYEASGYAPAAPQEQDAPLPGSETLSAIQQLEAELERHQRAQEPPAVPEAQSTPQGDQRPIDPFGGYTEPPVQHAEPTSPGPEFSEPDSPEPESSDGEPSDVPETFVTPAPAATWEQPAPPEQPQDAPSDVPAEPSLAGTAFESLFTAPAADDPSPLTADVTPSSFPGFTVPPSDAPFAPPTGSDAPAQWAQRPEPPAEFDSSLDLPAPGGSLPPQEDHGPDAPVFLEPHGGSAPPPLVEPPAPATPTGEPFAQDFGAVPPSYVPDTPAVEPVAPAASEAPSAAEQPVSSAPQPPAQPFGFESLVTGDADVPTVSPQPTTWLTPPAQDAPPPFDAQQAPPPSPASAPWQGAPPPLTPSSPAPESTDSTPAPPDSGQPTPGLTFPAPPATEAPPPAPPALEEPEGKRPFGEGVDRTNAIDPGSAFLVGSPAAARNEGESAAVSARQRVFSAERSGQEPTPLDHRVGHAARMFWLWFASNSSIVAVVFGGAIFALGLSLRQAIVAALAGVAVSFLPLGLGTLAGKRSGQPTMVVSRATFVILGNPVPAAIALVSRLFWGGALLWILGAGSAGILVGAHLDGPLGQRQLTLVFVLAGFVLAAGIAYLGYAMIARAQLVISIVATVLGAGFVALTVKDVDVRTALSRGDGPWILAVTGAVLVFSFVGLLWANSSSDLARYQRVGTSGAASMLWATFGAGVPSFLLIAYGALLAASNPRLASHLSTEPLDALGTLLPVWYPVPLLAAT